MNIEQSLQQDIIKAFTSLYEHPLEEVTFQTTRKDFAGTHTFVTFPFTKVLKKKPEDIANAIGGYLKEHSDLVLDFNVAKGFLNLSLTDLTWIKAFEDIYPDDNFGNAPSKNKKVVVEYSSPNTNKPLHLGHLRNNFLGYSIAQILKVAGYEVHKTQIINDRGIHICKSMISYQKDGSNEVPQGYNEAQDQALTQYAAKINKAILTDDSEDLEKIKAATKEADDFLNAKGDHLVGKYYVAFDKSYKEEMQILIDQGMKKEDATKEAPIYKEAKQMLKDWEEGKEDIRTLWKKMNQWVYDGFDHTYKTIGVDFDSVYYESETYLLGKNIVEEGLAKEIFFKKEDGSLWIDLTNDKLDEKLVLRSDGTSVYITQDIGTANLRHENLGLDKMIYVVGNEQEYHFKVLFTILKKLGFAFADDLHHLSYGMVDLPTGRMKTREGTVVDADLLVAQVLAIAQERTEELGKIEHLTEEEALQLYKTIGLGALKYFILKVDPKKGMLYNPQESIDFHGNTAPYIQYNYVRTASVKRNALSKNIDLTGGFATYQRLEPTEVSLIQHLYTFPKQIQDAADNLSPALIAQYVYDLTRLFSTYWTEVPILKAEADARNFRIALAEKIAYTIKKGMNMLGIEVPEKM